jgi:hypothetical protein
MPWHTEKVLWCDVTRPPSHHQVLGSQECKVCRMRLIDWGRKPREPRGLHTSVGAGASSPAGMKGDAGGSGPQTPRVNKCSKPPHDGVAVLGSGFEPASSWGSSDRTGAIRADLVPRRHLSNARATCGSRHL